MNHTSAGYFCNVGAAHDTSKGWVGNKCMEACIEIEYFYICGQDYGMKYEWPLLTHSHDFK